MERLDEYRKQIDDIDRQLTALFEQRMAVCRQVGEVKREAGLPVLDPAREQQVLQSKEALVRDESLRPAVRSLFENMMASSRMLQERLTAESDPAKAASLADYEALRDWKGTLPASPHVLYQGQPGAYCEEAAVGFFGADCSRMILKTWDGVFRGVKEGFGDYGVVPIENSSTGSINDVFDLLGKFGCYIVGEQIVPVEHCLLATQDANMDTVTDVYTHEQGFRQCRPFLAQYPKWNQHEMVNTALAAKYVAEQNDRTKAAIASRRAAELYGLQVLQTRINENIHNYTRFLVVAAAPQFPAEADKLSVRFTVPHTRGSLCRILEIFNRAGLNLVKLESRPVPEQSWEYCFYVDVDGSLRQPGMDLVVRELIDATSSFRILGSYQAAQL